MTPRVKNPRTRTKSVYSPIEPGRDGLRVLATRYRGRGLPGSRYDVWMANLGPSEKLLRARLAGRLSAHQFKVRYRKEILGTDERDARNPGIRNRGQKFTLRLLKEIARRMPVTLMCHCAEDEPDCHRHVLQRLIANS